MYGYYIYIYVCMYIHEQRSEAMVACSSEDPYGKKQTTTHLAPKATSAHCSCPLKGGQCLKKPTGLA